MRALRPLAIVATAAIALSGCSLLSGTTVEDLQLAVGECIDNDVFANDASEVGALPTIDCAEPHDAEVYFVYDVPEGGLSADIANEADAACFDEFEGYVGTPYLESSLYYSYIYPTATTYDAGDRQVACIVTSDGVEKLEGSVKGSGL